MIWGSIKAAAFVGLAVGTGVVLTTVSVGGKTLAERLSHPAAATPAKHVASEAHARRPAEREAPTPGAGPVHAAPQPTGIDPHAVAKVLPDARPADAYKPEERDALSKLIQEKARKGKEAREGRR